MTPEQFRRAVSSLTMPEALALIERETTEGDPVEIYWDIVEGAEMAAEMEDYL